MFKNSVLKTSLLLFFFANLLIFNACKDNTEPEELITTIKITFNQPGGASQTFSWKDLDGDGGNAPSIETIQLAPLTSYGVSVQFLNESVSPAEDVTQEIAAESNEHLVVFQPSDANLKFEYDDTDGNGKKLGLKMKATTDQPGSGKSLKITLFHNPTNKDNLSAPGGDVDVEVEFPVEIK